MHIATIIQLNHTFIVITIAGYVNMYKYYQQGYC